MRRMSIASEFSVSSFWISARRDVSFEMRYTTMDLKYICTAALRDSMIISMHLEDNRRRFLENFGGSGA